MPESVLSVLQKNGVVSAEKRPMERGQYDLRGGVPIVDIPRNNARGLGPDFVIYDNVTNPDGMTLIQGPGTAYHGSIRDGKLEFEVQKIEENLPFGAIESYPDDYYLASRQFVENLETRLR